MVYRNGQKLISQIKNDLGNLDKYVKEASNEEIDGALDLLLFSFLANERKFIDDLKEENLTDEGNTKNKYKFFNPETMIGVSHKKKRETFINPTSNEKEQKEYIIMENIAKPYFCMGQATRKQIEDKQLISVFSIKQKINVDRSTPEDKQLKVFRQKYKNMDLVTSSKYSKCFTDKDNNVYFTGLYPKKIDKLRRKVDLMSIEDIEEYMSGKILSEPYKHPADLSLEYSKIPTFYTIFDGLCNSISHNKVSSRDHYLYFEINDKSMPTYHGKPHYATIIIDKDWARAVCDTIMYAKSSMIIENVRNDLNTLISSEIPTKNEMLEKISSYLKEYDIDDCNIDNMVQFLNTKIPEEVNEKEYIIDKVAEYLAMFDTSLDDDVSAEGLKLPSKLYLILMDKIVASRVNRKEDHEKFQKIYNDLHDEYEMFCKNQNFFANSSKTFARSFETALSNLQEKAINIITKHQENANDLTKPYSGSFMFSPEFLNIEDDLSDEVKGILSLTQCLYPLNDFLSKNYNPAHDKIKSIKLASFQDYENQNIILRKNLQPCFALQDFGTSRVLTGNGKEFNYNKNNIDIIGFLDTLKAIRISTYHGNTKLAVKDDYLFLKFFRDHDEQYMNSDHSSKNTVISIEVNSMGNLADSNVISNVFPESIYNFAKNQNDKNEAYDYNLPETPIENDKNKNKD